MHIPTIATTHTMWEDFYDFYIPMARLIPVKAVRKLVKRLFRKFYALINVSSKARDYFKSEFMLPGIPSAVIPNAVDTDSFVSKKATERELLDMRKNWGIEPDDTLLLFVGRVGEEKRVLELLDICVGAVRARESVKALFVGSGPALEQMRRTVQRERLDHRIVFTGFVNWTDLHVYYGMSDVFMTASLSEMHSMTILEALISSLPIVARRDSSYLDTVFPGRNGFLADTDAEMLECVLTLVDDPALRARFGAESRAISDQFSIETHAKKTVAFYEAVLEAFPRPLDETRLRAQVEL